MAPTEMLAALIVIRRPVLLGRLTVRRYKTTDKLFRATRGRCGCVLDFMADPNRSDLCDILDRAAEAAEAIVLNMTNADALQLTEEDLAND